MKQGDIVLIPFPFTDQKGSKKRPALVISGSILNRTSDIMLVQITSNNRQDNFSISIDNQNDLTTPLRLVSEIRCNKLLVADKSLVQNPQHPISTVKPQIITKVVAKINEILKP